MTDQPAVLVTGGAGYIGSHACRALAAAGYQPVVYDNLSTGHRSFVAGPLVTGDLLDGVALARALAPHNVVAVMHFAASSLVGESVIEPQKYYYNNVVGTLLLLDAMREARCNRLLFSSTGGLWGRRQQGAAGKLSLRADQSLRHLEMNDRAYTRRFMPRLRDGGFLSALFQRQRRRSFRRNRRNARQ